MPDDADKDDHWRKHVPGWLEGHMTPGMQGAFQKVWDNRFNRHPVAKKRTQLLLKMSTLEPRLANAPVWILRHMRTDGLLFLCNECPDIATALCRLDNDIDELPMVFASVYKQGVVLSGNIVVVLAILGRVDVLSRITSEANVVVLNKPRENDGTSADADVLSLDSTLIINGEVSTVTALSALALLLCGGPFTARFHEAHASDFLRAYTTACFLVERGANVSGRTVAMDLYGVNASCYVSPVELLFAASIPGELFTEEFSGAPGHDLFVANTLHKLVADRARLFVANTPDKPVADRDHGSLPLAAITVSAFDNSAGTHFQVHPGAGVVWSAVAAGSGLALRALASKSWTTDQLLRPLTTTRLRFNPHHRTPVAYAVRRHATRPDIASFLLERTVEQARRCSGEDWRRLAGSVYRAAIVHQENEMHPPGDSCEALLFAALGAFARDIVNTLFLSMNRAAKAPEPTKQKLPFVDTYAKEMIAGVVLADFDKTMPKIPSGRLPIKAVVYRTNRVA